MFVIRIDHQHKILYATLQSESGQKIILTTDLKEQHVDSIIYIKDNKIYLKSDAIIEILVSLGGLWRVFKVFRIIPLPVRDWIYEIIAKNRYRMFGQQGQCMVPGPEIKDRFL